MITAIILSGGKGKRMESEVSKQYIELNGKPILYYTLKKFIMNKMVDKIILVIPKDEEEYCREAILEKYSLKVDKVVFGGNERQDSVYNGILAAEGSEYILIHDGARPFVTDKILEDGIKLVKEYKAVAPGVMPKDTIKVRDEDGYSSLTLKREELFAVQTPQIFEFDLIKKAHFKVKEEKVIVTDDTMAVEKLGVKVYLYDGDYTNIKVTTPEDLILAEYLARKQ
ncbi:MAG: 2-C-methyl-D-erythritol 4-phosphate cytidylyltransferase [Clostridium sp.]